MRRFAFLVLAVVSAACGARETEVSEQSIKFSTPGPVDTLLARATAELGQLGYTIGGREGNMVFTTPRPIPIASGATASAAGASNQLWFVHVVGDSKMFQAGSNGTVRAFLVPQTAAPSPGNVVQENAIQVTAARVEPFRELQRIAERLNAAANRGY